jgi:hypothetical protein
MGIDGARTPFVFGLMLAVFISNDPLEIERT